MYDLFCVRDFMFIIINIVIYVFVFLLNFFNMFKVKKREEKNKIKNYDFIKRKNNLILYMYNVKLNRSKGYCYEF